MSFEVIHGDCLTLMAEMEAGSVDAVVCDPPYGLEFMGKEWDRLDGGGAGTSKPGIGDRDTEWPSFGGSEFGGANPTCAVCGGRLRGAKKCECAEPDWHVKGKRTNGGGKTASALAMQDWHTAWAEQALRVLKPSHYLLAFGGTRTWHRLACALEDAGFEIRDTLMWLYGSGFPKGKACLKPAWEPIILARKPGPMRELGIEECRIGTNAADIALMAARSHPNGTVSGNGGGVTYGFDKPEGFVPSPSGRWPANLILDEEAAGMLDSTVGTLKSGKAPATGFIRNSDKTRNAYGDFKGNRDEPTVLIGDSGGPSRFFYCAKASRAERNKGLEGMEARQRDLSRHAGQPSMNGGDGNPYNRGAKLVQNHHPTVKPIDLMRWLVRLVAREGDLVLDPFTGSGTTGVACVEEGREFVGIEREAEYVEIARRRIDAAAAQTRLPVGRNFVGVELNHEYARMAERRMAPHRDQMQLVTPCPRTGA